MGTFTIDQIGITRTAADIDDNDLFEGQIKDGGANDLKSFKITKSELLKAMNGGALQYKALISQTTSVSTSGVLEIGKTYVIVLLESGDDFSNVDYVSDGVPFVATGTTPTTWSNGTEVYNITDSQPSEVIELLNTAGTINVTFEYNAGLLNFIIKFNQVGLFLENKFFSPYNLGSNNQIRRIDDDNAYIVYNALGINKHPIAFEIFS